jgi:TonB family protein
VSVGDHGRLVIGLTIASLIHGLLAVFILSIPPRPVVIPEAKKVDRYAKLEAIREKVELPKPKPPEPPPEKKPEPEVAEVPKAKPKAKRKRRKGQPKRKRPAAAPKPDPTPEVVAEPAPLVLSNLGLTGGVAVQAGDEDVFGDPSVAATQENTRPPPEVDDAPVAPPKRVAPRVVRRAIGSYPDDAPHLGRVVEVTLRLEIDEEGKVAKIHVVKGAGAAFDREARKTARRLRFKPGTLDDVPTPMWVPWIVVFEPAD